MLSRRSFLRYAVLTTCASPFLAGCEANPAVKVLVLNRSIPPQLLGRFRREIPETSLKFLLETNFETLYNRLELWQEKDDTPERAFWQNLPFIGSKEAEIAQLVTLGNYWFEDAIAQNLIQTVAVDTIPQWQQLPPQFQQYVTRPEKGQVWGAPYRFGSTVIAYNRPQFEKLGWFPQDWQDLWRDELKNRVSVVNQPREIIGLTLKKLGYSYNETDLGKIPNLEAELAQLNQQVKFYSSTHYLQPLVLDDVWATVGWSNDILPLQQRYRDIEVIVPASGTATWLDLWVQPNLDMSETQQTVSQQWMNYCWQENPAWEISLWTDGLSPILLTTEGDRLPEDLRDNAFVRQSLAAFPDSEIIEPLPERANQQYNQLWEKMRNPQVDTVSET